MSLYRAEIVWTHTTGDFLLNRYSRAHVWRFDGGIEVRASSSPQVVRLPFSAEDAVDPEEAFVASLASCHMLSFLYLAAKRKFAVESYVDKATGEMQKDERGHDWIARVVLHPHVQFTGDALPSFEELQALHHAAHEECFIANSVKTTVLCEPRT
jgi:organic hydroperoxide reductase OsmC/OhrA